MDRTLDLSSSANRAIGSVSSIAPIGKAQRLGGQHGPSEKDPRPVPLVRLIALGDPAGGDDVGEVPAVAPERGVPAGRLLQT